jgi:hypothetical protein
MITSSRRRGPSRREFLKGVGPAGADLVAGSKAPSPDPKGLGSGIREFKDTMTRSVDASVGRAGTEVANTSEINSTPTRGGTS